MHLLLFSGVEGSDLILYIKWIFLLYICVRVNVCACLLARKHVCFYACMQMWNGCRAELELTELGEKIGGRNAQGPAISLVWQEIFNIALFTDVSILLVLLNMLINHSTSVFKRLHSSPLMPVYDIPHVTVLVVDEQPSCFFKTQQYRKEGKWKTTTKEKWNWGESSQTKE